jgi:hypothetical protein
MGLVLGIVELYFWMVPFELWNFGNIDGYEVRVLQDISSGHRPLFRVHEDKMASLFCPFCLFLLPTGQGNNIFLPIFELLRFGVKICQHHKCLTTFSPQKIIVASKDGCCCFFE